MHYESLRGKEVQHAGKLNCQEKFPPPSPFTPSCSPPLPSFLPFFLVRPFRFQSPSKFQLYNTVIVQFLILDERTSQGFNQYFVLYSLGSFIHSFSYSLSTYTILGTQDERNSNFPFLKLTGGERQTYPQSQQMR